MNSRDKILRLAEQCFISRRLDNLTSLSNAEERLQKITSRLTLYTSWASANETEREENACNLTLSQTLRTRNESAYRSAATILARAKDALNQEQASAVQEAVALSKNGERYSDALRTIREKQDLRQHRRLLSQESRELDDVMELQGVRAWQ